MTRSEISSFFQGMFGILAIIVTSCVAIIIFFAEIVPFLGKIEPFLMLASDIATVCCIVFLLPLSLFRRTRIVSMWGFLLASYLFGLSFWVYGLLVTYDQWGRTGVFIGLFLFGFGVVPLGIIAAATQYLWLTAGELIFGVVLTFGARAFAFHLAKKMDHDLDESALAVRHEDEPESHAAAIAEQRGEPVFEVRSSPDRRRPFNNFIARNWRGEFPLWVSYWVFGFLGNIIIGLIPLLAVGAFSRNAGYEPRTIFATLVATWLGVLVVATWQLVGVWRSASRRIDERRRSGKHAWWASLAELAAILGLLRLLSELGNAGAPQIAESYRMAFMDDPDIPAYSIRIMRNGTEAEITGGFKYGLTDDFLRIFRASPQIRVVHLNSIGGRIGEAEKLNKLIHDHGLSTYVSAQCVSACTVAFAGGRERWLLNGAILGFHAPAFPGMSDAGLAAAVTVQKDLFLAAGFDSDFISRALDTPNKDVWTPSSDELLRARAITAVSDGSNFAASGYGADVTREDMAAKLTKVLPVLGTIRELLPEDYASIVDDCYGRYVNGQPETKIIAATEGKLLSIMTAYRPLADDAVLVDLGKLFAERYALNPTVCHFYLSGAGGASDFLPDIPEPLIQREIDLGERVIATAAKRPDVTEQMAAPLWEKVFGQLRKRYGGR
jgi:hypothetical protein